MPSRSHMRGVVVLTSVYLVLASATGAGAQSVGLGPRFSFVRADLTAETATRFSGGLIRLRTSPRTAVEVSLDYHSHLEESLTRRIKDYPIQGSLLLYLARTSFSPYLVGGIGWYSQRVDELQQDSVIASTTTRTRGYHAGLGGEVSVGRHAAIHVDYRYTFIGFGDDAGTEPAAVPIPGLRSLQDRLGLSHKGSMWTSGVTVYF